MSVWLSVSFSVSRQSLAPYAAASSSIIGVSPFNPRPAASPLPSPTSIFSCCAIACDDTISARRLSLGVCSPRTPR